MFLCIICRKRKEILENGKKKLSWDEGSRVENYKTIYFEAW